MSVEPNPIILSFYQSTLLPVVHAVSKKWNEGDYIGAFASLKYMYTWLPPVCKRECKAEYEKAKAIVIAIKNSYKEIDTITRYQKIGLATRNYLYDEVLVLSELFNTSLHDNGYLEKAGVKPKNEKVGRL